MQHLQSHSQVHWDTVHLFILDIQYVLFSMFHVKPVHATALYIKEDIL